MGRVFSSLQARFRRRAGGDAMKARTCTLALVACLLLPATSHADDTAVEQTFRAFSQCDAAFFASLHTHAATWQNHAPLKQEKNISWISVRNRALPSASPQPLLDAPQVGGLTLLSYFDTFDDLAELGRYLFWGFIVDGPKEQVARGLRPYIAWQEQLQSVDDRSQEPACSSGSSSSSRTKMRRRHRHG
jgi:hypothetical protein